MSQKNFPLLPLRDVVVFPSMVIPLFVGRKKSIRALEEASENGKQVFLVAQKDANNDNPSTDSVYPVGTIATILQLLKLPDGTVKVLVEGQQRAYLNELEDQGEYFVGAVTAVADSELEDNENEVLLHTLTNHFEQYVQLSKKVPNEVLSTISDIEDADILADTIAAHISLKLAEKQNVLEIINITERVEHLMGLMEVEIDLFKVEKRIRGRVKKQMEKSQREYYLNEQIKAIQKELSDTDAEQDEFEIIAKKIEASGMTTEANEKAQAELKKLRMMSPMSAEASVVRSYLDWLVNVPWKKRSRVSHDLAKAQEILDADHHGLDEVKERILEYLAVQGRVKKVKGAVLCLVGPPGVGKTSLGKSIARATNRKFVRMALGGVRDEAEIRGHRRTYVGSMPGRIVQNLNKAGAKNPLFVLDEIDKMSMDFRGDPSSALLEVLDPEQNHTFNDHYLEVDLDLSEVMFIATSNSLNIPGPLLDRMEVIRIPGYTEEEKINIASRYLVRKQLKANGLKEGELKIAEGALRDIVRYYTREAGVRNLEREIARICRKVVKEIALAGPAPAKKGARATRAAKATKATSARPVSVTSRNLEKYLGVRRHDYGRAEQDNEIGMVTGLAWTEVGGDLLQIEATHMPGKGNLILTGQLGEVMKESASAAHSIVRARGGQIGLDMDWLQKRDIHVHVPDGATPKDGPSAGIAMTTALVSMLAKIPVRSDVAMTGEITLRGKVTEIGGLKEKLLAALRGGIRTVIIPEENRKDLAEIPKNVTENMEILPVKWIEEVLDIALERPLPPKAGEATEGVMRKSGKSGEQDRVNKH